MPWFAVAASAVYMLAYLRRGWVPHDEGTIGQSAERFLNGDVPHVDFIEIYTGGLTMLNALAFRALGIDLVSPRIILFLFAVLWTLVVYWIARRFTGPIVSSLVTISAVTWSLPNYFAALPSWYNLFLATFGAACLLRFSETRSAKWLALSGICAGLSVLIKISGLYFVAAGLLFLVYYEQDETRTNASSGRNSLAFSSILIGLLATFVALESVLVWSQIQPSTVFHYLLPSIAIVSVLAHRELTLMGRGSSANRAARLGRLVAPFGAGVATPIVIFVAVYAYWGGVNDLLAGVFVAPRSRLEYASFAAPGLIPSTVALSIFAVIFLPVLRSRVAPAPSLWLMAAALGSILAASAVWSLPYALVFFAARSSAPLIVLLGAWTLAGRSGRNDTLARQKRMVLLSSLAVCSLIQFPYAAPIYFCYLAPLVLLGLVAASSSAENQQARLLPVLAFVTLFAVMYLNTGYIYLMGHRYELDRQSVQLPLTRGGIHVTAEDAMLYSEVVRVLNQRAAGSHIFAGPDSPEVYFLAGYRNPTRDMFDFFSAAEHSDRGLISSLDSLGVTAVVINSNPSFSPPLSERAREELSARYPNAHTVGRFEIRWKP